MLLSEGRGSTKELDLDFPVVHKMMIKSHSLTLPVSMPPAMGSHKKMVLSGGLQMLSRPSWMFQATCPSLHWHVFWISLLRPELILPLEILILIQGNVRCSSKQASVYGIDLDAVVCLLHTLEQELVWETRWQDFVWWPPQHLLRDAGHGGRKQSEDLCFLHFHDHPVVSSNLSSFYIGSLLLHVRICLNL